MFSGKNGLPIKRKPKPGRRPWNFLGGLGGGVGGRVIGGGMPALSNRRVGKTPMKKKTGQKKVNDEEMGGKTNFLSSAKKDKSSNRGESKQPLKKVHKIRKAFPDTWIWIDTFGNT